MKNLKINVPEGYEIDKEKSSFEEIVFKKIEKTLPKSWEDLGAISGYYTTNYSTIDIEWLVKSQNGNQNTFFTKEQAQASIALAQLSQLREVYRQGWKPDFNDLSQRKYGIHKLRNKISITIFTFSNAFLSFQSKEIAHEFLENFRDLIENASPLLFD